MTRNREQKSSTSSSISMCKMMRPTHRNALFNRRATVPCYFQEVKENHWMVYNCTQGDNCSLYCFEASIAHWNDSNRDPNWLFMNADRIFRRKYRSICDSDVCGSIKRKHTHTQKIRMKESERVREEKRWTETLVWIDAKVPHMNMLQQSNSGLQFLSRRSDGHIGTVKRMEKPIWCTKAVNI